MARFCLYGWDEGDLVIRELSDIDRIVPFDVSFWEAANCGSRNDAMTSEDVEEVRRKGVHR